MDSESGMDAILPDINCEFYLGQLEGYMDALNRAKAHGQLFNVQYA
jgi:hypothetical protein